MVTEKGKSLEKVKENGQQVKTQAEICFEEMRPILEKHRCEIICVPQTMYGQTVYVPMINEIKK